MAAVGLLGAGLAGGLAGCVAVPGRADFAAFVPASDFVPPAVAQAQGTPLRVWVRSDAASAPALQAPLLPNLAGHLARRIADEGQVRVLDSAPTDGQPYLQLQPLLDRAEVTEAWVPEFKEKVKEGVWHTVPAAYTHTARLSGRFVTTVQPAGQLVLSQPFEAVARSEGHTQAATVPEQQALLAKAVQTGMTGLLGYGVSPVVREVAQTVRLRERVLAKRVNPANGQVLFQLALGRDDGLKPQDRVSFYRPQADGSELPLATGVVSTVLSADSAWVLVSDPTQAAQVQGGDRARELY